MGKLIQYRTYRESHQYKRKRQQERSKKFSNIKENLSNETEKRRDKRVEDGNTKPKEHSGKHAQWTQSRRKNIRMGTG